MVLQTLMQRTVNLLASWAYQLLVTWPMDAKIDGLAAELHVPLPEANSRPSTVAAIIAVTDWAFEYPFPIPPKLHVSVMPLPQSALAQAPRCLQPAGCMACSQSLPVGMYIRMRPGWL